VLDDSLSLAFKFKQRSHYSDRQYLSSSQPRKVAVIPGYDALAAKFADPL
jgi:hypothetical protein